MYEGAALCGMPLEVSQGFLWGWYAQNGVSLKNDRLGFVCTSQDMDGQYGMAGYFYEFDHALKILAAAENVKKGEELQRSIPAYL